jgi:hypothetical protein
VLKKDQVITWLPLTGNDLIKHASGRERDIAMQVGRLRQREVRLPEHASYFICVKPSMLINFK